MGKLTLEDIRPYLQGAKQKGAETAATCPLCGKPEHLYIKQDGERLLMHCHKCNAPGTDILKEFRRLGAKHEEPEQNYQTAKPIEDYYHIYRLPNGEEQFRKRRRKWADGHKQFTFEYTDADGKKQYKMPADAVILYNLDKLAEAAPETPLYVVEGEKCADSMLQHGLLATTSRTGAQKEIKFTPADQAALEKFKLKIIIPDNDEKGLAYAAAFKEYACKILALPDIWEKCPKKGDIADYFAAGGKVEAITGYEWEQELTQSYIDSLDVAALLDPKIFKQLLLQNGTDRIKTLAMLEHRARALRIARSFRQAWKAYQADSATPAKSTEHETCFTGQPLALACGEWIANDAGIYRLKQQGDIVKKEHACKMPIMPAAVLRNIETDTEKIKLAFRRAKSAWSTCIFPRSTISNKNKIIELADRGILVNSNTSAALVTYLGDCLENNAETIPIIQSVERLGWVDGAFVPYDEALTLDNDGQGAELARAVHSKGTLEEWAEYIAPLRKQSLYLQIVLAAAFASVLISKVKTLPFVLHLWGGTGTGKTVALKVAASVWGNPEKYMLTLNGTTNALMGTAALLHDLPLLADELQTIKLDTNFQNQTYDKLIMQLTEGKDRARLTQQSTLKDQKTWNNCFIFTGEEPITQSNSGGGTKNRVIELQCKEQIVSNGNAVVNFIDSHYGSAGRAFIEHIASKPAETLQQNFQDLQSALLSLSGSSAKQCATLALIALADAYAAECIFKDKQQVLDLKQLAGIAKSLAEIDSAERAYRYIMDVIAANADYFTRKGYKGYYKPATGACWGKLTADYIAINRTRITEELAKQGYSLNSVTDAWKNKGYILTRSDGRITHTERLDSGTFSAIHLKNTL